MQNKLPEKLTLLRKHSQYSQGDVSQKLNVPVTEYMKWENGNAICSISQLKQLADLYQIPLDDLVNNTKSVVLPSALENSVTIPFMNGKDINQTQTIDAADNMLPVDGVLPAREDGDTAELGDSTGHTKVMDTANIRDEAEKQDENDASNNKSGNRSKSGGSNKKKSDKKKKQSMMIIGGVCALVVIIVAVILIMNGLGSSVSVSSNNRIAVGDTYSLYVDQSGKLEENGDFSPKSDFKDAVQVSAFGDHAVELLSNGTVISSDGNSTVSSWKNITYVAAGKDHTAAVTKDGEVKCTGNDDACEVSSWKNISSVYAGNGITVGVKKDGSIEVSGKNTSSISDLTGVSSVSFSTDTIAVLKTDGTVSTYIIGSGSPQDTSSWKNMVSVCTGKSMVAGLSEDGTVDVLTSDTSITDVTDKWSDIRYIDAYDDTIVAIDKSGKMYGAGDNSHNQYKNSDSKATASASTAADTLDKPSNITVTETTANINIKWDKVDNADYYECAINTDPETDTKTTSNSASVPTSSLVDGQSYTITITAKSNDETKYGDGVGTLSYTYKAKTVTLDTPSGISAKATDAGWVISWNGVNHADTYGVSLDGNDEQTATTNTYTYGINDTEISTGTHTITVTAYSSNSQYSASSKGSASLNYAPTTEVMVTFTFAKGTQSTAADSLTLNVGQKYTAQELVDIEFPGKGYTASGDDFTPTFDTARTSVTISNA
jgi:transcriptional regulator with XRE-family HTH domain